MKKKIIFHLTSLPKSEAEITLFGRFSGSDVDQVRISMGSESEEKIMPFKPDTCNFFSLPKIIAKRTTSALASGDGRAGYPMIEYSNSYIDYVARQ